jgi:hypothetical protein
MGFDIVVFTKKDCVRCDDLKIILKDKKVLYRTLDVDFTRDELLIMYPSIKMYPLIVWYGKGYTLEEYTKVLDIEKENKEYMDNYKHLYHNRFK